MRLAGTRSGIDEVLRCCIIPSEAPRAMDDDPDAIGRCVDPRAGKKISSSVAYLGNSSRRGW
jgi:hypothetical protein